MVKNAVVHIGISSPDAGARLNEGGRGSSIVVGEYRAALQSTSRHAEMDALRYLRRHDARKVRLVVGRFQANGTYGNSRPCIQCIQRIKRYHPNVKSVTFYENGKWLTQCPLVCAESSGLTSAERRRCHDLT